MKVMALGDSGIKVSAVTLGGNVFGWTADEVTSFAVLDAYLAGGGNCIDTADAYSKWAPGNSGGESETVIGRWLKRSGRRQDVLIATKVGMEITPERKGLSAKHIKESIEQSLRRLQTEYVDIYQSHIDDPLIPLAETLGAYDALIKEGKVRYIGASNFSAARLSEALQVAREQGLPKYISLQPLYNLYDREIYERELEAVCLAEKLGVISFYPLAAGFLTGKYRSKKQIEQSARAYKVALYFNKKGERILQALDEVALRYNVTQAQIALSWVMSRPSITAPIASATSVEQLEELLAATELVLDPEALALLREASTAS